jgi:hypothetical protein
MIKRAKEAIKQSPLCSDYFSRRSIHQWITDGYSYPPPHALKSMSILYYALTYRLRTLVETGTYLGDMVWAQKDNFDRIYSIELSTELFQRARTRFARYSHIKLIQGDSSDRIAEVVKVLDAPALFWLDGHYSGGITAKGAMECPVFAELDHIFKSAIKNHVILIDDARLFVGANDYPTIPELKAFVLDRGPYDLRVENDFIFISGLEDTENE